MMLIRYAASCHTPATESVAIEQTVGYGMGLGFGVLLQGRIVQRFWTARLRVLVRISGTLSGDY